MPTAREIPFVQRLISYAPPGQFRRYLLVGGINTIFGYGTFALLTAGLDRVSPYGYIVAGVLSTGLNITFSYVNYKWFVFKTKGNYLREWSRCVAVYSGGIALTMILLPMVVFAIRRWTIFTDGAPYIAGALLIGLNAVYSFLGHKNFSFRAGSPQKERIA
jgi:putative flippase GtrA